MELRTPLIETIFHHFGLLPEPLFPRTIGWPWRMDFDGPTPEEIPPGKVEKTILERLEADQDGKVPYVRTVYPPRPPKPRPKPKPNVIWTNQEKKSKLPEETRWKCSKCKKFLVKENFSNNQLDNVNRKERKCKLCVVDPSLLRRSKRLGEKTM